MIGKTVRHIRYGTGAITREENGKVYVQFDAGEKLFPYTSFETYLVCDDPDCQREFLRKAEIFRDAKEKSEKKKREEINSSLDVSAEKNHRYRSTSSKGYNCWIKFEGQQNEMVPHEVMQVKDGGRTIYILNYVRRPSGVEENAKVFVASGIQDDDGVAQQVITGRGVLAGFDENNIVKPEWVEEHEWMSYFSNYLVLKEYENLNCARRYGLKLDQVFAALGGDTYPSSEGRDITIRELRQKHTQKMHLRITDKAADYIDGEFDKLVRRYGSTIFHSDVS